MRFLLLFFIVPFALCSHGQTIDKAPIYEGTQNLSVRELGYGRVYWGYQNPEYTAIVDIVSFSTDNAKQLILLMDECLRILEMDKTGKDNHIRHEVEGVKITRYGFAQKKVYLHEGLQLTMKNCLQIKTALEDYTFTVWVPEFSVGDSVIYTEYGKPYPAIITSLNEGSDYYGIKYSPLENLEESSIVKASSLQKK